MSLEVCSRLGTGWLIAGVLDVRYRAQIAPVTSADMNFRVSVMTFLLLPLLSLEDVHDEPSYLEQVHRISGTFATVAS